MDKNEQSLIKPDQGQLFAPGELPEGYELLTIEARKGTCTGERIARDQDRYAGIVQMIAEGCSLRRISRAWGISVHTVQAIRDREASAGAVATVKKKIASNLRAFAESASERLLEEVDNIPIGQLPLAAAIAIDKVQLLDGEATSRHETTIHRPAALGNFDEFLDALPRVQEMGLAAGETGSKGAAPAGGSGEPAGAGPDNESGDDGSGMASNQGAG